MSIFEGNVACICFDVFVEVVVHTCIYTITCIVYICIYIYAIVQLYVYIYIDIKNYINNFCAITCISNLYVE